MEEHTGRTLAWLGLIPIVAAVARPLVDPDLWWHLRTGRLITESGIPDADPYSFTVRGRTWVTHEWLSEVIMWTIHDRSGAAGLIVAFTLIGALAFGIAFATSQARPGTTSFIAALAAWAAAVATGVRPQMFNLVGLAFALWIMERVRRSGRARDGWPLIVVTILWVNLHSGYLLGCAVVGAHVLGALIERKRRHGAELTALALACFAVAVVNPSGAAMWRYPFDTLRSPVMRDFIAEWASPDFHEAAFAPFLALLVISAVSMVVGRTTLPPVHGLLLATTAVAALQSIRHIAVFAIVAVPIVAPHVDAVVDRLRSRRAVRAGETAATGPPKAFTAMIALLTVVASIGLMSSAVAANDIVTERDLPSDAVDYLERTGLVAEPGFNQYRFGGYLIWRDVPVFVDGRADVYGDEFLSTYVETHRVGADWRRALDDHGVAWIMIEPDHELGVILDEAHDWQRTFGDDIAVIFERSD